MRVGLSNNPPDVVLNLTHGQATFMLENCIANRHLALKMIMLIGEEKVSVEEKQRRAEKFVRLNDEFGEIMKLLHKAGAKNKDEDDGTTG